MLPGHSLSTLPLKAINLTDKFWLNWQSAMTNGGLMHQWKMCEESGRVDNLRRCASNESGGYEGKRFNDSDVYKLMEACAYALSIDPNHECKSKMDEVIEIIASAQMDDGYLNSYVQLMIPKHRWKNLNGMHEMYCAGHLIEAGVAHFSATGERKLLETGIKFADHIMSIFGPDKKFGYPGHQELELALVRLAAVTDEQKYFEYAQWLTEARGSENSPFKTELAQPEISDLLPGVEPLFIKNGEYNGAYAQDDVPLAQQTKAVGHSVRAMYFYCGAVDCLGDNNQTMNAVKTIWDGLVSKQMYVTGGIGSSESNEGFTKDYDLPNLDAYAETCAAIGLVFWGWRMFILTGETKYIDTLERSLFNAVMSGVSPNGKQYFYENPLESDGRHTRKPWYACACCPPNIARLIMSIGQYAVASSESEISIAMPLAGTYETECGTIAIESNYPWSANFTLTIEAGKNLEKISLRVPEWATDFSVTVNGETGVSLERDWQQGDQITVTASMQPTWVESHPEILSNAGRVALQRGPIIYSLEELDLGFAPHHWSADTTAKIEIESEINLVATGMIVKKTSDELYQATSEMQKEVRKAKFIPNYMWADRGANKMLVWVRRER